MSRLLFKKWKSFATRPRYALNKEEYRNIWVYCCVSRDSFLSPVILSTFFAGMRDRHKVKHSSLVQGSVYLLWWPFYNYFCNFSAKNSRLYTTKPCFSALFSWLFTLIDNSFTLNKMSRLLDHLTCWQFYAPEGWNSPKHSSRSALLFPTVQRRLLRQTCNRHDEKPSVSRVVCDF